MAELLPKADEQISAIFLTVYFAHRQAAELGLPLLAELTKMSLLQILADWKGIDVSNVTEETFVKMTNEILVSSGQSGPISLDPSSIAQLAS